MLALHKCLDAACPKALCITPEPEHPSSQSKQGKERYLLHHSSEELEKYDAYNVTCSGLQKRRQLGLEFRV